MMSSRSDDMNELPTLFDLVVLRYEGETSEGRCHGEGTACFEGGHLYKGMFSKGLMDGRGVFTQARGLKYEGEFVCNKPMGQGTYTWPDGSSYKGEVHDGVRHGTGTYTCAKNAVTYTGQWDRGRRHGRGVVYYNQAKTSWYKGDWVKNNREGRGVRCYPSGNLYCGEWRNNLRHGEGTMKWLDLGQQYVGTWLNGVQQGRGTHIWTPRQADGSQYSPSNRYAGDFVQGQRHGRGAFWYASGVIYEGEWSNNRRHAKGRFTFKDGRVLEGELTDEQMMAHNLRGAPRLLGSESSVSVLPDMALNVERLLGVIPGSEQDTECKQVESVILMHSAALRSIHCFYRRLGHGHPPEDVLPLIRLQLWRLLKDCDVHHHGITLTHVDRFIGEDATADEIHSPFTPILLSQLLGCLVVVAYHIYHKDMASQKNLLAACFSKLMTDNILPNAKKVKGFLFRRADCAMLALNYIDKCWEIYQAHSKVNAAPRDDPTMTHRDLLYMFKDLNLLDNNLTTARLLEIINAESHDPGNPSSCLDLEITFLEFFEVLLGSAEVKCQPVPEGQLLSSPDNEARRDIPELEANGSKGVLEISVPSQLVGSFVEPLTENSGDTKLSTAQDVESQQDVQTEVNVESQSAEQTGGMEANSHDLKLWMKSIPQFFNQFLFPNFEHNQLSRNEKEETLQTGQGPPSKEPGTKGN